MCVIMIADTERPTHDQVAAMDRQNPHGMGIAWRENDKVRWRKGIKRVDEMIELIDTKPFPFVAHWRIPTVGPDIGGLNHPFTINNDPSLALEGETDGWVLFHNGGWAKWKEVMFATVERREHLKLPTGKWSDSRAMAFVAAQYGLGYLEFIGEATTSKMFAFGPKEGDEELFGDGWVKKASPAIWVSNTHWEFRSSGKSGYVGGHDTTKWQDHRGGNSGVSRVDDVTNDHRANKDAWDDVERQVVMGPTAAVRGVSGGTSQMSPFRTGTDVVRGGSDEQQGMEKGGQAILEGEVRGGDQQDHPAPASMLQTPESKLAWAKALNGKKYCSSGRATTEGLSIEDKRQRCKEALEVARLKAAMSSEVELETSMRRQRIEDHKRGVTHLCKM